MEIESQNHSNSSSSSSSSRSPEFEFWMVNNHPELEQLDLHTADELFVDGVILPLHLLSISHHHHPHKSNNNSKQKDNVPAIHPEASILSTPSTASKRWKDMFRKKGCPPPVDEKVNKKKEKRAGETPTQLNINIWPFSRSRSAGTDVAAGQKKPAAVTARKSSSAPCSRSNSRGESTGRWAASPGRPGIYVGRTSPVWKARRKGLGLGFGPVPARPREKGRRGGGGVKGLNVNSCIGGYGRCVDEEERVGGSLFRFRGLFSKKVY